MPQFHVCCSQDLHILHQFFMVSNKSSRASSLVGFLIIHSGKLMWLSGENEAAFTIGVSQYWQCKLFLCSYWIECSNVRLAAVSYLKLLSWQLSLKQSILLLAFMAPLTDGIFFVLHNPQLINSVFNLIHWVYLSKKLEWTWIKNEQPLKLALYL